MEFGHIQDVDKIAFELPPDHRANQRVLGIRQTVSYLQPQVYIGCPTWANKAWLGSYYPAGTPDKELLHWYSKQFNTIEVNTTYYRIPDTTTINRWRDLVTPNFTFCPKLPQLVSQDWHLTQAVEFSKAFYEAIQGLDEHLGMSFLQLPPTFGLSKIDELLKYLEKMPEKWPLAIELRDPTWFAQPEKAEILYKAMEDLGVATVITDVAGRRDVLHQRLTCSTVFIRFNGYGLHSTDYTRIDAWVQRLLQWIEQGLQTVYFFVHQQDVNHAPVLINYLIDKLKQQGGISLEKCRPVPQPVQGSLF